MFASLSNASLASRSSAPSASNNNYMAPAMFPASNSQTTASSCSEVKKIFEACLALEDVWGRLSSSGYSVDAVKAAASRWQENALHRSEISSFRFNGSSNVSALKTNLESAASVEAVTMAYFNKLECSSSSIPDFNEIVKALRDNRVVINDALLSELVAENATARVTCRVLYPQLRDRVEAMTINGKHQSAVSTLVANLCIVHHGVKTFVPKCFTTFSGFVRVTDITRTLERAESQCLRDAWSTVADSNLVATKPAAASDDELVEQFRDLNITRDQNNQNYNNANTQQTTTKHRHLAGNHRVGAPTPVKQARSAALTSSPPNNVKRVQSKPILVLDMDETLIHTQFCASGTHTVLHRPGLFEFLEAMHKVYKVVIFTAGTRQYADAVMDSLDAGYKFHDKRMYREHCTATDGVFCKDLHAVVGQDISRTIIVDNIPENYSMQPNNGIPISDFTGDPYDNALKVLQPQLLQYAQTNMEAGAFVQQMLPGVMHVCQR